MTPGPEDGNHVCDDNVQRHIVTRFHEASLDGVSFTNTCQVPKEPEEKKNSILLHVLCFAAPYSGSVVYVTSNMDFSQCSQRFSMNGGFQMIALRISSGHFI